MESEKQYAMFIHLSQLAGSIVVGLGWILPLVLWLTKKDSSEYIDANGKIVMNWIISCLIYGIVSGILCLIGIGVVLLIALAICNLTFIIIGSVKASQGSQTSQIVATDNFFYSKFIQPFIRRFHIIIILTSTDPNTCQ